MLNPAGACDKFGVEALDKRVDVQVVETLEGSPPMMQRVAPNPVMVSAQGDC
jgi:hypothetical protein